MAENTVVTDASKKVEPKNTNSVQGATSNQASDLTLVQAKAGVSSQAQKNNSDPVFQSVPNESEVASKESSTATKKQLDLHMSQKEIESAGSKKQQAVQATQSQSAQKPVVAKSQIKTAPAKSIVQNQTNPSTNISKQSQSAASVSAPNPNASQLPKFASATNTDSEIVDSQNPNIHKTPPKTTGEKYLDHNQKATGSFINKIFGRDKKKPAEQVIENEDQKKIHEAEKVFQQGLASVRDLIAPSSLEIHFNHLKLSGVFVRSFFVYTYPRFLDTNWLSPVINFDATVDIAQFIYPINSAEIMCTLKKKVAQIQSSISMAREKGNVRDPALETALEDAEQLRTDLQRGQEKFFQFGLYFTVYAEDESKLEAATKRLESLLGGKLVLTKRADIQGEHALNSTLPLAIDELEVWRNMNTSPLSTTFPFVSSTLATDDGILYGLNRHNNSLIIFDRFQLPNANSCVFASSGAGKSYAVKLEILRQAMLGTDVIIIDPENEYEELAKSIGGTYLRVSLNSEQRINPFDLPAPFEGQDLKPGDLLRESTIMLTGLTKLMLGDMTSAEEALIDKALLDTYAVRGITMDTEDLHSKPVPTMEDFHSVLSSMKGAEDISQRLQKYTTGTFGGIFNKPTNVDLNSGLVVFCIRDLEDELRPIAMYILLNYIWNLVRSEMKKRLLVVDEAWTMMQHEDAAKFLYGLVKRARKYYLGITTITQDVEDFLRSPYGKPVVTNAAMQLLLKQSPSSIDVLQKTFNLTDGEKYMLLNSGVGQGLFFADNKHVAIQVIASYGENQIVTTNPEEILKKRKEAEN